MSSKNITIFFFILSNLKGSKTHQTLFIPALPPINRLFLGLSGASNILAKNSSLLAPILYFTKLLKTLLTHIMEQLLEKSILHSKIKMFYQSLKKSLQHNLTLF